MLLRGMVAVLAMTHGAQIAALGMERGMETINIDRTPVTTIRGTAVGAGGLLPPRPSPAVIGMVRVLLPRGGEAAVRVRAIQAPPMILPRYRLCPLPLNPSDMIVFIPIRVAHQVQLCQHLPLHHWMVAMMLKGGGRKAGAGSHLAVIGIIGENTKIRIPAAALFLRLRLKRVG